MAGYMEYKDSGIPWLGEYPAHWECCRVKNSFFSTKTIVGEVADSYERLALTLNGVVKRSKIDAGGLQPERFETYQVLRENELVFKLIDLQNVSTSRIGRSPYTGIVSPAYIILHERNNRSTRYAEYYFLSMWMHQVFNQLGADGVRSNIGAAALLDIPFLLPPESEQESIVTFLDVKINRIDTIIAEAKASIEEYKAWKASIIYEVVTKGLNPNAEMTDSNIEWIGEMPAHWKLIPFRYVLSERNEKNNPVVSTERLSLSIDLGVTLYADKTTNLDRLKEDFTQYKIAHEGDLVMNSMNMIVGASGVSAWFGCVSPAYYTFYDTEEDHVTAKFCEYIFRNKAMLRVLHSMGKGIYSIDRGDDRVNTCRLKVPKDELKSLLIPIPPIEEQRKIVDCLTDKCNAINALIAEKEELVTDLESYKKSLIFEVVTGKRKVV